MAEMTIAQIEIANQSRSMLADATIEPYAADPGFFKGPGLLFFARMKVTDPPQTFDKIRLYIKGKEIYDEETTPFTFSPEYPTLEIQCKVSGDPSILKVLLGLT